MGAKNPGRGQIARSMVLTALKAVVRQGPPQLQTEGSFPAPALSMSEAEDMEQAGLRGNFQLSICYRLLPGCIMLIKPLPPKWLLQKRSAGVQLSVQAQEERMGALPRDEGQPNHQDLGICRQVYSKQDEQVSVLLNETVSSVPKTAL